MDKNSNFVVKEEPASGDYTMVNDEDVIFVSENVPQRTTSSWIKEEPITEVDPAQFMVAGGLKSEMAIKVAFYQRELEKKDFALNMVHYEKGQLVSERDELLKQLQREISKSEALRIDAENNQKSYAAVIKRMEDDNENKIQELTNQRDMFHMKMHDLEDALEKKDQELEKISEEQTCSICLSPWEAQGTHRLVSLACGHLFGDSCIRSHLGHNPCCPYCKQPVHSSSLRYIFGCRIQPRQDPPGPNSQTTTYQLVMQPSASQPPPVLYPLPHYQMSVGPPASSPARPVATVSTLARPTLAPPAVARPTLAPPAAARPTLAPPAPARPTLAPAPPVLPPPAHQSSQHEQHIRPAPRQMAARTQPVQLAPGVLYQPKQK